MIFSERIQFDEEHFNKEIATISVLKHWTFCFFFEQIFCPNMWQWNCRIKWIFVWIWVLPFGLMKLITPLGTETERISHVKLVVNDYRNRFCSNRIQNSKFRPLSADEEQKSVGERKWRNERRMCEKSERRTNLICSIEFTTCDKNTWNRWIFEIDECVIRSLTYNLLIDSSSALVLMETFRCCCFSSVVMPSAFSIIGSNIKPYSSFHFLPGIFAITGVSTNRIKDWMVLWEMAACQT